MTATHVKSGSFCLKGTPVKLERIPMELLLLLTSRPGELVARTEIIEKLWRNGLR
jgi:DNA-binding response OmpR family regulator